MGLLEDMFETLGAGFNTGNLVGMINIILLVVIFGGALLLIVWTIWKMLKYKSACLIYVKRGSEYEPDGWDRYGIFKDDKGQLYAKLRRRKTKVNIANFEGILRDKKMGDLIIFVKEGEGSFYQVMIPKTFYNLNGSIALPVLDHNIMKQAARELLNDVKKVKKSDTLFQKYGAHIAILVVVFVLIVGGYILLRKEEQHIGIVKQLIDKAKGIQEAAINQAIAGG